MEKEYNELLLDLSARVPYGVMVEQTLYSHVDKEQRLKSVQANNVVQLYWYEYINDFVPIHCIKPYLRSMSSMTEEEFNEYESIKGKKKEYELIDWLNAHHFDYRGLIEKCLAIEAPKDMYNIKEK